MHIYVICKGCKKKLYLTTSLTQRGDIYEEYGDPIGLECSRCGHEAKYPVRSLTAEEDANLCIWAVTLGAVFGLIGGPLGVLVGAFVGFVINYQFVLHDKGRVKNFNTKKKKLVFV